jgi:hypothetical protein
MGSALWAHDRCVGWHCQAPRHRRILGTRAGRRDLVRPILFGRRFRIARSEARSTSSWIVSRRVPAVGVRVRLHARGHAFRCDADIVGLAERLDPGRMCGTTLHNLPFRDASFNYTAPTWSSSTSFSQSRWCASSRGPGCRSGYFDRYLHCDQPASYYVRNILDRLA